MGACVSSHRISNPDSAMKAQLSYVSKPDNFIIPSPTKDTEKEKEKEKEKPPFVVTGEVGLKPQWPNTLSANSFHDFGSKEEIFFDSQAWLDSDCESDFMSVNGEFTPSRGNTPVHHKFSVGTLRVNGGNPLAMPEPSPTPSEKRMRLSDLFKQSVRNQDDEEEEENTNGKVETKSAMETEASSVCSSELTPSGSFKPRRSERLTRSLQRCFPSLLSSSPSSAERRRKNFPSPAPAHAIAVGDK